MFIVPPAYVCQRNFIVSLSVQNATPVKVKQFLEQCQEVRDILWKHAPEVRNEKYARDAFNFQPR